MTAGQVEVSVILPCLNEEATIGVCVRKAVSTLEKLAVPGEVLVVDNGSTDRSIEIATSLGARVVHQPKRGYGNALIKGLEEARGRYLILADSDDSYDLTDLGRFVQPLRNGLDVVIGNRFAGGIMPGAMPWKNRYIGNPILSRFLNLLFHTGVSDAHCGMRSLTKEAFRRIQPKTPGMEFASEMIIKAAKAGLRIGQIPITLYPDGRNRASHLKPWRDGWRHLKFLLMFSPTHLFLVPGLAFLLAGLFVMLLLLPGPLTPGPLYFGTHWMIVGSLLTLLGFQVISLHCYAKIYSTTHRFRETDRFTDAVLRYFTLERGFLLGGLVAGVGFSMDLYVLARWIANDFGPLKQVHTAVFGSTLIVLGVQTIFGSFFLSILGDEHRYGATQQHRDG